MELTERSRTTFSREKWRLYVPNEDEATSKMIVEGLVSCGHEATPTPTYWKNQHIMMFAISFEAAVYVSEHFPNPRFKRALFHQTPRGWFHWREGSLARNPLIDAYDNSHLFARKRTESLPRR